MKTCKKCEKQNPDDHKFCKECGGDLFENNEEIYAIHKTKALGVYVINDKEDIGKQREAIISYYHDKDFDLVDVLPTGKALIYLANHHDKVEAILFWDFNQCFKETKEYWLNRSHNLKKPLYTNGMIELDSKPYQSLWKRTSVRVLLVLIGFALIVLYIDYCPKRIDYAPVSNVRPPTSPRPSTDLYEQVVPEATRKAGEEVLRRSIETGEYQRGQKQIDDWCASNPDKCAD